MKNKRYILLALFIGLISVSCDDTETSPANEEVRIQPAFVTTLNPIDSEGESYDVSQNVIQGMTPFEQGWFTTQTSANTTLLINYLNEDGSSLFHQRISVDSHGQDLSLEQVSDTELYLYTSIGDFDDTRSTGLLRLKVILPSSFDGSREMSQASISIDKEFDLNYTNATPTISEDKQSFAIRSKNTIHIHDKKNIEADDLESNTHFAINTQQLKDNEQRSMWFQGIVMNNGLIYCLTGNSEITTEKKIYIYNQSGITEKKHVFDINDFTQSFAEKFEPETLSISGENLYFTMMTKDENGVVSGNIKYLYKISI